MTLCALAKRMYGAYQEPSSTSAKPEESVVSLTLAPLAPRTILRNSARFTGLSGLKVPSGYPCKTPASFAQAIASAYGCLVSTSANSRSLLCAWLSAVDDDEEKAVVPGEDDEGACIVS